MTTRTVKIKAYSKRDQKIERLEYGLAYSMEIIGLIITGYGFIHKGIKLLSHSNLKRGEM